jgi:hypothetical protein
MIVSLAFAQGRNRIGNEDFMELIVEICQLKIKEVTDSRKIVLYDGKRSQYHNHCGRKKLCATVHHSSFIIHHSSFIIHHSQIRYMFVLLER